MSNENFPKDLQGIMDLAQKLQGDMTKMQDELASMRCDGSAGGGMVTATVNGNYDVVSVAIEKEVIDPEEQEMLQDLIVAAINQAVAAMREKAQSEMTKVTGGLNIPGMPPTR